MRALLLVLRLAACYAWLREQWYRMSTWPPLELKARRESQHANSWLVPKCTVSVPPSLAHHEAADETPAVAGKAGAGEAAGDGAADADGGRGRGRGRGRSGRSRGGSCGGGRERRRVRALCLRCRGVRCRRCRRRSVSAAAATTAARQECLRMLHGYRALGCWAWLEMDGDRADTGKAVPVHQRGRRQGLRINVETQICLKWQVLRRQNRC